MGAIETLISNVDGIILGFVQGSFGSLSGPVQTLWRLMFIVFIAVYGYKVIISGKFSTSDLITHCVKIIALLVLATQWDHFFIFVYRMVTDLPSDIAGKIMEGAASILGAGAQASSETTANGALSSFFDRGMLVVQKLLEGAHWNDFTIYFYAGAVALGTVGLTGYAAMLIILSKIAVAILLALGPIFLLLLIFTTARGLFEGWLRTLLNYAVVPVFVYTLLAFLLTLAEQPLKNLEAHSAPQDAVLTGVGPFMLIALISILLLMQIMNMAASVTGGLSLSTMSAYKGSGNFAVKSVARGLQARKFAKQKAIPYMAEKTKKGQDVLRQALKKTREVQS